MSARPMQFIEQLVFPMNFQCILLLLGIITNIPVYAGLQFSTSGGYVLIEDSAGTDNYGTFGNLAHSSLLFNHDITEAYFVSVEHRLDGSLTNPHLPENSLPLRNQICLGVGMRSPFDLALSIANDWYPGPALIAQSSYQNMESVRPIFLNQANLQFRHKVHELAIESNLIYYNFSFEAIDTLGNAITRQDADLWPSLLLKYSLPAGYFVQATVAIKRDLAGNNNYDIDISRIGVGGENQFARRKFTLDWNVAQQFYKSKAMYSKSYADGFSTIISVRPVLSVSKGFYIKGAADLLLAEANIAKQHYELELRRSWRTRTATQISFWSTFGGLFPRGGGKWNLDLLFNQFRFSPSIEAVMRPTATYKTIEYCYGIAAFESGYSFGSSYEIFLGLGYKHYVDLQPFSSRFAFHFGVQKW